MQANTIPDIQAQILNIITCKPNLTFSQILDCIYPRATFGQKFETMAALKTLCADAKSIQTGSTYSLKLAESCSAGHPPRETTQAVATVEAPTPAVESLKSHLAVVKPLSAFQSSTGVARPIVDNSKVVTFFNSRTNDEYFDRWHKALDSLQSRPLARCWFNYWCYQNIKVSDGKLTYWLFQEGFEYQDNCQMVCVAVNPLAAPMGVDYLPLKIVTIHIPDPIWLLQKLEDC